MVKKQKIKVFSLCYLANVIKIICTLMIPFTNGMTMYASSFSIIVLLALFPDQILLATRLVLLSIVAILWILIIVMSIISIRNQKSRIILSILSIIMAIFDCVLPIIFSTMEAKIASLVLSLIIITLNIRFITNNADEGKLFGEVNETC